MTYQNTETTNQYGVKLNSHQWLRVILFATVHGGGDTTLLAIQ
jgi:hypothetical protein